MICRTIIKSSKSLSNGLKNSILSSKFFVIFFIIFFTQCNSIKKIDQPQVLKAGQIFKATLQLDLRCVADLHHCRLIFGFLAPRSWECAKHIQVNYHCALGSGTMRPVSPNAIVPGSNLNWLKALYYEIGTGSNRVPDMEWVVFETDKWYDIKKNDPDITGTLSVNTPTGMQNMRLKLGYFIGDNINGLKNDHDFIDVEYANELQVTNGYGKNINFCQAYQVMVTPIQYSQNSPITVTFDANVNKNILSHERLIYFSSKAYTQDNQIVDKENRVEETRLWPIGNNRWVIQFIPASYYQLAKGQKIKRIEFLLSDKSGRLILGRNSSSRPFTYNF